MDGCRKPTNSSSPPNRKDARKIKLVPFSFFLAINLRGMSSLLRGQILEGGGWKVLTCLPPGPVGHQSLPFFSARAQKRSKNGNNSFLRSPLMIRAVSFFCGHYQGTESSVLFAHRRNGKFPHVLEYKGSSSLLLPPPVCLGKRLARREKKNRKDNGAIKKPKSQLGARTN